MKKTVIGIDIGGTKIHGMRMDKNGDVYKEIKVPTEAKKGYKSVLETLTQIISDLMDKSVKGIGVGIASPIDYEKGLVVYASNIPGWENVPLKNILEKKFKLPITIENDAKCFVIAEHKLGAGKGYKNMVGITVGTGIGGGIIINNKLYRGRDNIAGEIGHMTINFDVHDCKCGNKGCFEKFASGTAILERTLEHIQSKDFKTKMKPKGLTTRDIYKAATRDKDPLALHIVIDTGRYLGIGLANIINVINPEIIVLGGSVAKYNYYIFKKNMKEEIKKRAFSPANSIPIKVEKLDYPGTVGAALIAF